MRFENILLFVALFGCSAVLSRSTGVEFTLHTNGYPVVPLGENCLEYAHRILSARFVPKHYRNEKNCNSFVNQTVEAWRWAIKFSEVCGVNVSAILSHHSFHTINGDWHKFKCVYTESMKPAKFNDRLSNVCSA